jgi:ADP-heptose:LPS heptosyltransferase
VNRWGASRFAELADVLTDRLSAKIILIGGTEDRALAEEIAAEAASGPLVLCGKATLLQTAAILYRCDLLVSGDTGPLHLATAVGTGVLALFGAADPDRTGPAGPGHRVIQAKGVACVPCRSRACKSSHYLECMENLLVRDVADAAAAMVGEKQKSRV